MFSWYSFQIFPQAAPYYSSCSNYYSYYYIHPSMIRFSKWSLSFTFVRQILFPFYFSQAEIRFAEKSVSDLFCIRCPVFSPRLGNDRKVCRVFPQSHRVSIVRVSRIRHGRFLPHHFQFTTHESSEQL